MIPFVSSQEMARIDREAQQNFSIPGTLLMEQAGVKSFQLCMKQYPEKLQKDSQLVFFSGKGNNGGDALVMAREAHLEGFSYITIVQVAKEAQDTVQMHLEICRRMGLQILHWEDDLQEIRSMVTASTALFDGITGTGINGPLRGPAREAVRLINSSGAFVVSIDVPSGIYPEAGGEDSVVRAEVTVSMGLYKTSCFLPHTRSFCGDLLLVNPGFPPTLLEEAAAEGYVLEPETDCFLPLLPDDSYKTTRGFAAVFAGSSRYPGAARLASQAAMATRAGMVSLLCDRELYPAMASSLWESIILEDPEDGVPERATAVLCGPGWGREPSREGLLARVLEANLPTVIDADGLAALARLKERKNLDLSGRVILTPHPGEFRLLSNGSGPIHQVAGNLAQELNAWIIYKTHIPLILGPKGECYAADGANPSMGTAGTGDVLSGLISGLLAEGCSPRDASIAGVLIHQCAGKAAYAEYGWFSSHQLLPLISQVIREVEQARTG